MPYWMCTSCGHCLNTTAPPEQCPHCGKTCSFADVTCYRPECGGEQNVDPLIASACYNEAMTRNRVKAAGQS